MKPENPYDHTINLVADLSCLLDDIEHDLGLEEYTRAEKTTNSIIDHAALLQKLLKLLQARTSSAHSFPAIKEDDIPTRLVELEQTCRCLAEYGAEVKKEIDLMIEKHRCDQFQYFIVEPAYQLLFSTSNCNPLITHPAVIKHDDKETHYFQIEYNEGHDLRSRYIFDQLNQCTPCHLDIDEISSITTVGYELTFSVIERISF